MIDTMKSFLDFWTSYTLLVRLVIFLTITAVLSIWFFLLPWLQSRETSAVNLPNESSLPILMTSIKEKPVSIVNPPAIKSAYTAEEIRVMNGVRELTNSENELNLYRLPNGVYGWVEAYHLNSPELWIPNSPFGPDHLVLASNTKLRKIRKWNGDVEVHKDKDGVVRILAFINDSSRIELQQPIRTEPIRVLLAFRNYEECRHAVSIPRERIRSFHHRNFGDDETVADACVV
jgi:hypothetical protein